MSHPATTRAPRVIEMTICSALGNVQAVDNLARRLSTDAGLSEEDIDKVEMAVHESTINAIMHGNKNDARKFVHLHFQLLPDRLEIRVRDEGNGFDPQRLADPLSTDNLLKASGRGIFLIRAFMDEFRVGKVAGSGTEVTLIKNLHPRTQPQEGGRQREHEGHGKTS